MANPTIETRSNEATSDASVANIDMKLEVVIIPVADVDRAREFYKKLGWRLDVTPPTVVQFTPPGPGARSNSARRLHRPRLGQPRAT